MSSDIWKNARSGPSGERERSASTRAKELRLHGLNAVLAMFTATPERLRKLYLSESRLTDLKDLLKWCVQHRVGYRVVEDGDLSKLAQTSHHEGVVADVLPPQERTLEAWLAEVGGVESVCAIWLDGVGNPHNLGAIMRNAAHFGASAMLIEATAVNPISGASARVAEGGAERISVVRLPSDAKRAMPLLRDAGFGLVATLVRDGADVYKTDLPAKLIYVMGAEQQGMHKGLAQACDVQVSIPGTGEVESLNVASATAVFLAEWYRRRN